MKRKISLGLVLLALIILPGCLTASLITFKGDCDVPPSERVKPCIVEAQEYYVKESVNAKGTWSKQYYPRNSQTQMAHDMVDAISDWVPGK